MLKRRYPIGFSNCSCYLQAGARTTLVMYSCPRWVWMGLCQFTDAVIAAVQPTVLIIEMSQGHAVHQCPLLHGLPWLQNLHCEVTLRTTCEG